MVGMKFLASNVNEISSNQYFLTCIVDFVHRKVTEMRHACLILVRGATCSFNAEPDIKYEKIKEFLGLVFIYVTLSL